MSRSGWRALVAEARGCTLCAPDLPLGPRPIFQLDPRARILIASQAPGRLAHEKGLPFYDPSGRRLREWLGVDEATFYDPRHFAIVPMGFCFPGTGKGGDMPPRPECAETWRERMLAALPRLGLTCVIGSYALDWHLPDRPKRVADTVRAWRDHLPELMPLPHPSPRNNRWLREHPWFEAEVVPALRTRVRSLLGGG